jgi:hypothetical protein
MSMGNQVIDIKKLDIFFIFVLKGHQLESSWKQKGIKK